VIGPEITWSHRPTIEEYDLIPQFDGNDYVVGTNQVEYALAHRSTLSARLGQVAWRLTNS
jgi:hypothetical protein